VLPSQVEERLAAILSEYGKTTTVSPYVMMEYGKTIQTEQAVKELYDAFA
jgi:adapter protein MecA 1/2